MPTIRTRPVPSTLVTASSPGAAAPADQRSERARLEGRADAAGLDGPGLLDAFRMAVDRLAGRAADVDALNVFPVPDGDTGSNMLATVRAALAEADDLPSHRRDLGGVAAAIGFGALMGARGNSGVILSQVLRGVAESLRHAEALDGTLLAQALSSGSRAADAAVTRPVEGTILTVARDLAEAALRAAADDAALPSVLRAACDGARRSVERTPELLAVLRDAGVVDAGGFGLAILLEGMLEAAAGERPAESVAAGSWPASHAPSPTADGSHAPRGMLDGSGDSFGYETMFVVRPTAGSLDLAAIRAHLESIGEAVLVAGDERAAKVHVHNDRPDHVVAYGLSLGTLNGITIQNMDDQARAAREEAKHDAEHSAHRLPDAAAGPAVVAVVAVASGAGLARLFESLGARSVVRGGQGDNPSVGELLDGIRATDASEVIVLPNHPGAVLATGQAAALCPEVRTLVVATRNTQEGIAAILALDPARSAGENHDAMRAAAGAVQTLHVTSAIRDAAYGSRRVRRGDAIVLDAAEGLVATDVDLVSATVAGVAALTPGFELLTLYRGEAVTDADAELLADRLRAAHPGVEIEIVDGGQAHYHYLVAAE